jgi:hypothetical protein
MSKDRISGLLTAYFNLPYDEYGDIAQEIKDSGGLTSDEVRDIQNTVLRVDANALIRHTGSLNQQCAAATATQRSISNESA